MMGRVFVTFAIACALACPAAAGAQTTANATLGVTVDPVFGTHAEPQGTTLLRGEPLLTIEGSARYGVAEIYAEGLPPVGTIPSSGSLGTLSTQLDFVFVTARGYFAPNVSLGIGETVYHQVTVNGSTSERDTSNIAGLRYELHGAKTIGRSAFDAAIALTPVMRGGVLVRIAPYSASAGEHASQSEAILRDAYRVANGLDVVLGVRYVNYVARYATTGNFADRNSGAAIVLGVRGRFGR